MASKQVPTGSHSGESRRPPLVVFIVWLAYQLGKSDEISKREDQEVENVIQGIKDGSFGGSFKEAHSWLTIGRATPSDWSDSFTEKVKKRLIEEARRAGQIPS